MRGRGFDKLSPNGRGGTRTLEQKPPFALSLSKGRAELAFPIVLSLSKEAPAASWHFDKAKPCL